MQTTFIIHSYLLPTPRYLVSAKVPTNVVWTTDRDKAAQFADFDTARALSWEIGGGASRVEEIAADTADRNAHTECIQYLNLAAESRAASDEAEGSDFPTALELLARADAALALAVTYALHGSTEAERDDMRARIFKESDALARARRFLTGTC